ncbi:hypothetical protein LB565_08265 [Mesorhizobium sp. CA14]|uniref:hypothetical protein n=1 Tax=Mesorhizobium sp. CA14 TaxID=2876642 RepID=UPI001CCBA506|nr:hypothetical protein [Mesorhizobium sp. CA14]MBZ9847979.1 hypothetical protein [Mesorhizobium sp. CA14]
MIRFSQYILNLSRVWRQSLSSRQIVTFDQGFIQAVCSLGLFSGTADAESLEAALDLIPFSDLAVSLDATEPLLSERLRDRLFHQSYMERLFEADPTTNLQSMPIINRIKSLLLSKGRSILTVDTSDERSLQEAIFRIETEIGKFSRNMCVERAKANELIESRRIRRDLEGEWYDRG